MEYSAYHPCHLVDLLPRRQVVLRVLVVAEQPCDRVRSRDVLEGIVGPLKLCMYAETEQGFIQSGHVPVSVDSQ